MAFFFLAFSLFSKDEVEEVQIREIARGNWSVAMVELTSEGKEKDEPVFYNASLTNETIDGPVTGKYFDVDVEFSFTSRLSFDLVLKKENKNIFEHSFTIKELYDGALVCTGRLEELDTTFSLNILSYGVVELSLFNTKTSHITIYRCKKYIKPQQSLIWLLPMVFALLFIVYINFIRKDPVQQGADEKQKKD